MSRLKLSPSLADGPFVDSLGKSFKDLELAVERLERLAKQHGAVQCPCCLEWLANERGLYRFLGTRCLACVRVYLHAMRDHDGPEWTPIDKDDTRKAMLLELASLASRFPVISKDANEAIDAVDEQPLRDAWLAARLTVSI